jgi:hypothetical protein
LCGGLALVSEPTTQLFEQGIVATFLFVQVRTNWIRVSPIKIKEVYYYFLSIKRTAPLTTVRAIKSSSKQ